MLYDVVTENFFSPLAAPGRQVYWECIQRLFAITSKQLSFGVERDILVDDLEYYFDQSMAAQMPEETENLSSRDKANQMLRRLEGYGWIYTDVDYSYVQRVHFRDYAIRLIRTLLQIQQETRTEYQGYIYTIYNLARDRSNPGLAITQMAENTELLITGLKSLNANIKKYIDDLTRHSTVAEILDALLNDYYSNVVDKAYHRLMTSDNVSKFRPEIIQRLEASAGSTRYMNSAARYLAQVEEVSEDEGRERAEDIIHSIIEAFRQMDEILREINEKNTRYQRAAIGRARFLLTSGDDVRGQLKEIMSCLNEAFVGEGYTDHSMVYQLEEMDQLIKIFSWDYLDMDSLYIPRQGRAAFVPQELQVRSADPRARKERREAFARRMERVLSAPRIEEYVQEMLAGRQQMTASDLPLGQGDTFIRLIYIRLYGQRRNMAYEVIPGQMTEKDGYRFRDFVIRWKEKRDGTV